MGRCNAGALRNAIFSLPYYRPANLPAKSPGGSLRLRVLSQQSNQVFDLIWPSYPAAAYLLVVSLHMKFRAGSPADAEAIATLIASFQSELTDDPSGAGAEEYLA